MYTKKYIFKAEITADPFLWRNMNVYIMFFSGDPEIENMTRAEHNAGNPAEHLEVSSPVPTEKATLCIYAVPKNLPGSEFVSETVPLTMSYDIYKDGGLIQRQTIKVNPWGGIQLTGLEFE